MATQNDVARARREGELFGIPLGDLGWFQSLLMGLATGMAAFFLATFVSIFALLVWIMFTGKGAGSVDFALAYKAVGLPVGAVVMVSALGFLGVQWAKRMARRAAEKGKAA
jgi:hypothetical protein